jgi:YidC/Oxa1 family membrane protein insertase
MLVDRPDKLTAHIGERLRAGPLSGARMASAIPVFFALFNTLRGAVELRHAEFLYIADLSMPDTLGFQPFGFPIRPLAIMMGGTMFLQQQLTPSSADPSQKRMMNFMTLFFMFIFYSMPSGLTLYWTTNQVLTILQNLVTRRLEKRKQDAQ